MACGLACVATRVSGSEDVLQHGVDGVLVEPEDYQGMAEALLMLLRDPGLAQRYAQAGRAKIERQYSLDRVAAMYAQLYDQVAAGTRRFSGHQRSIPAQHASHQ
jgi:glycosyltransferase involved in cell wall biosynthesis